MTYWTQVREGSDVSQTVVFGMPEANSAQLSSWMKPLSLPRVNPEPRERSCPRHFFASVPNTTQTPGQELPGARIAANLIERAIDQASNEGKCLAVIGPPGKECLLLAPTDEFAFVGWGSFNRSGASHVCLRRVGAVATVGAPYTRVGTGSR